MTLRKQLVRLVVGACLALQTGEALAAQLVVVEARGTNLRPGMRIDSSTPLQLKEGEKVVLIAPDGRAITLRGVYRGQAGQGGGSTQNPSMALTALVSVRRDRASAVGAVRSGAGAADLPDPWLIDITRPGERCIREGESPTWWRPTGAGSEPFTVYPLDRSWKADFVWQSGASTMLAPELGKLDAGRSFIIKVADNEFAVRLNVIPRDLTEPMILASWMLQMACFQQADAYLRAIQHDLAQPAASGAQVGETPPSSEAKS